MQNNSDNISEREQKFPGLGLLQNPKCTKRKKVFFKTKSSTNKSGAPLHENSIKMSPIDDFKLSVIQKLENIIFPLPTHDRCDSIKVLLEAAYYQHVSRSGMIEDEKVDPPKAPS